VRESPHAHWYVVGAVCIGAFMGQLDASIVRLALPGIGRDFHASGGAVEWVALAYLLVLVATVAAVGRIADAVGRKLLYVYGFGVFTAGSVLCSLAPPLPVLIAARVLQAIGAAMLQANSVAPIAEAMPASLLGRGIGVQGGAQALGLALGPAVGGLLLAIGGWRLILLVNLPAGAIGLALGWFCCRAAARAASSGRPIVSAPCSSPSRRPARSSISRSPAERAMPTACCWRVWARVSSARWPSSDASGGSPRRSSISRSCGVRRSRPGSAAGSCPPWLCSGSCSRCRTTFRPRMSATR
jgi:MFS family permease